MDLSYFWTGWSPIIHTVLIATVGYLSLVIMLRGTGPRTMAKMTPLDFVVAVTLGSTFGRVITAVDVSVAQALAALVILVAIQWLLAAVRARWTAARRVLDAPPVLLYYGGQMQDHYLRKQRLTEWDVHAAARQAGMGSLTDVQAVVLHQDGSLGVITTKGMGDGSSLLPYTQHS